ncbi:MAG: SDR family oxidoreductase [Desulfovibrio sp.]|jgi:UDP-N-acetylglucosamine 4-epimerase|nr:SDR family oxidoreductase [Desulfovibrio sp.]
MSAYRNLLARLAASPQVWLVTGAAGFIGSHLVQNLLKAGQVVRGLDNFSSGSEKNLEQVRLSVGPDLWPNFELLRGDIRSLETCRAACAGVSSVLHQAALGSVPRSLEDPLHTNANNIDGFLNMLVCARDACIRRFVYAASSSTYGDDPSLPKREDRIGRPLSPYALTKYVNELYAGVFASAYDFPSIGLRYFNIFGQRQDPEGAYAAVIPAWFSGLLQGRTVTINGDGETSRDFCFIDNCVQANLLAACSDDPEAWNQVYNVACGQSTTLNELFVLIREETARHRPETAAAQPQYRDFRPGDVRHSLADISKAETLLGYQPEYSVRQGLRKAGAWYTENLQAPALGV